MKYLQSRIDLVKYNYDLQSMPEYLQRRPKQNDGRVR